MSTKTRLEEPRNTIIDKDPGETMAQCSMVVSYICDSIAQVGQTFSITEEHASALFFIGKMVSDALSYEADRARAARA